jgi:ABC-type transporter Mla subunit MlaD
MTADSWVHLSNWFVGLPEHTQIFLAMICGLGVVFQIFYSEKTVAYGPTILTTTGIFATFVGIALGLSEFDTSNIQASVPELLGGLKTAFWASVAGVGGALLLKFRHYFLHREQADGSGEHGEVTAEDLAILLRGIQTALVGGEETSLITQIKLLRQDTNDGFGALKQAQLQALEKLSAMGSQALVEALRDVIKDFNAKITEQFGDNFKELNEAVGRLLVWQNNYRAHIETVEAKVESLVGSMAKASDSYDALVSSAGSFSMVARDLGQLLQSLETQKQQLTDLSRGLANLLREASGSLPNVERKVVELADQLTSAVALNQKTIHAALTENAKQLESVIQSSHQSMVSTGIEANRQVTVLVEKTKEQVSALDAALTEELKKSLESLGRQLTALSERFVADYTPLTDKLRRVVELAR